MSPHGGGTATSPGEGDDVGMLDIDSQVKNQEPFCLKPLWFEISVKHFQSSRVRFSFVCMVIHTSSDLLVFPFCSSVGLPTLVFGEISLSRWA